VRLGQARHSRRAPVLALAAAVSLTLLTGCASGSSGDDATVVVNGQSGWRGTAIRDGYPLPDQRFTDTAGSQVVPADDAAQGVTLVFFGYTHCPDICQIVMSSVASAVSRLDAAQKAQVQVLFVTTDPARDDRAVLRRYLDRLDPSFEGLTGKLGSIVELAKPLKVYLAKGQRLPSGGYEVEHTTYVFGVTGDQARIAWSQDTSPAEMAADIIRLLKSTKESS
jgi:protein SCO1